MTFGPNEPWAFDRFLDKFRVLDHIPWTEETIDESIKQVCGDIIAEGIHFTWLRFSINKYLDHLKWHKWQALHFIADCFRRYGDGRIGLILSIKYESARAGQRKHAALIDDERNVEILDGLDFVGNEAYFDSEFYAGIVKNWHQAGKIVSAHVGESQSADNVFAAIKMGLREISHGIKAATELDILGFAKDNDVCFHMCPTSNALTGVWDPYVPHPAKAFLSNGLKVTIGTDDPIQCSTNLDREFQLIEQHIGFDGVLKVQEIAAERFREYNYWRCDDKIVVR